MIRDLFTFPSHRQGAAYMVAWLTAWLMVFSAIYILVRLVLWL